EWRQSAPGLYQIPSALADRHQEQQRSAAGGQSGTVSGLHVSRWPDLMAGANIGTEAQALNWGGTLYLLTELTKAPSVSFVSSVSGGAPETGAQQARPPPGAGRFSRWRTARGLIP
ncbi:hypothetical protein, partial [Marinobacter sp.]|uniref:hypothetical protein n=1 Tax=Marinobacter sp. TaxID=50741 RepID=UPI0025EDBCF7